MHGTYQIYRTNIHWSGPASKFYQAQFKLASSVQVQLGTETGIIINVRPTHSNQPHHTPTLDKYIVSTQEAEILYAR